MIKSIKIRLEPNNKQITKLLQCSGTARFIYNWAITKQEESYKNGNGFIDDAELRKEITQLKKTEPFKWLNLVSNDIPKQAVKDACNAYRKFFKKIADKPKFKSKKKSKPSFYNDTYKIMFSNGHVQLSRLGKIRLSEKDRVPIGVKYYNPRVTFDGLHWYISVGVNIERNEIIELTGESIGIDLGIKYLAVCSNRDKPYENINKTKKIKNKEKKLRRLQRKVSKKYQLNKKGVSYVKTSNIIKLEKNILKLHKNLDNIRTDYRHKVTTEIVRTKPSQIVMECLSIKNMMKNRQLAKFIAQQGFYKFKSMMKGKSEKYGIKFIEADKWFASSKICSKCGHKKSRLSLCEREFICENCGLKIDRDKNASINLSRYKMI